MNRKPRVQKYIEAQPRPACLTTAGQYVQLQGVGEDTPVHCLGNMRVKFGIFIRAILAQDEKVRNGKVVFAYIEKIKLRKLLQT
ncbi:hypothetical protein HD806DRAFT_478905 [Xylariaceae sp. AK1471]|nr:hypothetical protein HD806DRAFT_478905 [Xylariaceae sp. AK1471]